VARDDPALLISRGCSTLPLCSKLSVRAGRYRSRWMSEAPHSSSRSDRAQSVIVIEDNPEAAAEAEARMRRVLERMDRLERLARGLPLRGSLQPTVVVQQSASARVPLRRVRIRARRPNRRARPLANRRAGRGCRRRDPDLPHPSALTRADCPGLLRGAPAKKAIAAPGGGDR
jgi:hypothetical protein